MLIDCSLCFSLFGDDCGDFAEMFWVLFAGCSVDSWLLFICWRLFVGLLQVLVVW